MQMMKKRRFSFPHPALADAQLEPIVQPLYSMAVLETGSDIPSLLQFFKYGIGGTIAGLATAAGTVASTKINTNAETPGFIASPKVFLATGTRLLISPMDSVLTEPGEPGTAAAATVAGSFITNFLKVLYGTVFNFFVGTKDYLTCPAWAVPCNVGVGGLSAMSLTGSGGVGGPLQSFSTSFNTSGKYFSFGENQILIPSQQNFHTSLSAPQAVPPQPLTAEMAVYSILDGILGREVQ